MNPSEKRFVKAKIFLILELLNMSKTICENGSFYQCEAGTFESRKQMKVTGAATRMQTFQDVRMLLGQNSYE